MILAFLVLAMLISSIMAIAWEAVHNRDNNKPELTFIACFVLVVGIVILVSLVAQVNQGRPASYGFLEESQTYILIHQADVTVDDNGKTETKTFVWVKKVGERSEILLVEVPEPVPNGLTTFVVIYPPGKKIAFLPVPAK